MLQPQRNFIANVLGTGLDKKFLGPADLFAHVKPSVLAEHLPRETLGTLLDTALRDNAISEETMLETATPDVLARHVPPAILWECVEQTATRAGITKPNDPALSDEPGKREFLARAIEAALQAGFLMPADVVSRIDPLVLVQHFPGELVAKLLSTSLDAGTINPEVVVETIGIDAIARHAPIHLLWDCASSGARRALNSEPDSVEIRTERATTAKPGNGADTETPLVDELAADAGESFPAEDTQAGDVLEIIEELPADIIDGDTEGNGKRGLFGRRKRR